MAVREGGFRNDIMTLCHFADAKQEESECEFALKGDKAAERGKIRRPGPLRQLGYGTAASARQGTMKSAGNPPQIQKPLNLMTG
jgi:hypothetical protein